jgi:hypothetical protein
VTAGSRSGTTRFQALTNTQFLNAIALGELSHCQLLILVSVASCQSCFVKTEISVGEMKLTEIVLVNATKFE